LFGAGTGGVTSGATIILLLLLLVFKSALAFSRLVLVLELAGFCGCEGSVGERLVLLVGPASAPLAGGWISGASIGLGDGASGLPDFDWFPDGGGLFAGTGFETGFLEWELGFSFSLLSAWLAIGSGCGCCGGALVMLLLIVFAIFSM
jgi:hypothetical protein